MSAFEEKFDTVFIKNTSNDPIQSIFDVLNYIIENTRDTKNPFGKILSEEEETFYPILVEGSNLIKWICSKHDIEGFEYYYDIVGDISEYNELRTHITHAHTEIQKLNILKNNAHAHNKYDAWSSEKFTYKFSEEDVDRIQTLINELRNELKTSDLFEVGHKNRLLARLEKLQAEMHKEMSNFDNILGLVGDAGVALGKFGKDVKPFTDRIIEIAKIGWKTQVKSEGLPENTRNPLLEIE